MTTDTLELPELPKNEWQVIGHPVYTAEQLRAYALQYGELVRERCARIAECEVLRGTFTQEEREYWGELIASAIRNKE